MDVVSEVPLAARASPPALARLAEFWRRMKYAPEVTPCDVTATAPAPPRPSSGDHSRRFTSSLSSVVPVLRLELLIRTFETDFPVIRPSAILRHTHRKTTCVCVPLRLMAETNVH